MKTLGWISLALAIIGGHTLAWLTSFPRSADLDWIIGIGTLDVMGLFGVGFFALVSTYDLMP